MFFILRIEKEALHYFTYNTVYNCAEAIKDLEGSSISCPDFKEVITPLVQFYRHHKTDRAKQVKIR
jgi:hypothetical protein